MRGSPVGTRGMLADYGVYRFTEAVGVRIFPGLGAVVAILNDLRRKARENGVAIREAKEIFFLDMVLTALYVAPLALVSEVMYQFTPEGVALGGDREWYFIIAFLLGAPAVAVTFVMAVESLRALALGVIRGGSGTMFSLSRNGYAMLHLVFTIIIVVGALVALVRLF